MLIHNSLRRVMQEKTHKCLLESLMISDRLIDWSSLYALISAAIENFHS